MDNDTRKEIAGELENVIIGALQREGVDPEELEGGLLFFACTIHQTMGGSLGGMMEALAAFWEQASRQAELDGSEAGKA